jgi:hypothetical protein
LAPGSARRVANHEQITNQGSPINKESLIKDRQITNVRAVFGAALKS